MNTSASGGAEGRRSYQPTTALAKSVEFTDDVMRVTLTDGRVIVAPLDWFPVLHAATPEQRAAVRIGGGGVGLHWPDLDEDLSMAGLLAGTGSTPQLDPNLNCQCALPGGGHIITTVGDCLNHGGTVYSVFSPHTHSDASRQEWETR